MGSPELWKSPRTLRKLKEDAIGEEKEADSMLKKGTAFKNTSWLLIGSILRMLVQFVIGAIAARYLGPTQYGALNYVNTYVTFFSVICELGVTISIVNEYITSPEKEGKITGTAITLRLFASFASFITLWALTSVIDRGDTVIIKLALIRGFGLFFEAFNTITYWYQSKLQSKYTSIFELSAYVLSSIFKVFVLVNNLNIFWFAASSTLDIAIIACFLFVGYKKQSQQKLHFDIRYAKRLLTIGFPFIISGVMICVYGQTDRFMIKRMLDETSVGFYSCAASIGVMIGFIPLAIMNSGKAVIMEAKEHDLHQYELRVRQTLAAVLWIMTMYAVFMLIFGKYVILILFGSDFLPALLTLKILVWSSGLSYVGTIRNIWLICENKRKYSALFSFIGGVLNILLNFPLIKFIGIDGAAIATVITQLLTSFLIPFLIPQTRRFAVLLLEASIFHNIEFKKCLRTAITKVHDVIARKKHMNSIINQK